VGGGKPKLSACDQPKAQQIPAATTAQLVSDDSMPPPLLAGTTTSQPGPFSGTRGEAAFAPPAPGGGPIRSLRSISLWRSSLLMSVWTILSSSVCSSLRSASSSPSYIRSHTHKRKHLESENLLFILSLVFYAIGPDWDASEVSHLRRSA
jgi:hypothetical protein